MPDGASAPETKGGNFEALREIASLVNSGSDLTTIFDRIVNGMARHTSWKRCAIMAIDRSSGYSVLVTRTDPTPEDSVNQPVKWALATSPSLKVADTQRPLVIKDAQTSTEFPGFHADSIARNYHTVVILPLSCTDMQSRQMVLSVSSASCVRVADEELNFLTTVCHLAAIAVDKEKSLHAERLINCRLERTLQINSSLLERVLAGSSMTTISGIVASILPDQIVIIDFTSDAFHVGGSPDQQQISDREWAEIVKGTASGYLTELVLRTEPTEFRQSYEIDLTQVGVSFKRRAYVEPLQVDGETVGGMVIFPKQRGMDDLDLLIAQEARFALSVQIMRAHIQFRKDSSQVTELFDLLFRGEWTDANQITNRANRLSFPLSLPARLLAIDVDRIKDKQHGSISLILRRLNTLLKSTNPGAAAFEHENVIFVCLSGKLQEFEKFEPTLGRQILETVQWQFGWQPLIAFGPQCDKLEDFQTCYEQCVRLLKLGKVSERHGLVRQVDFGPFALVLSALDKNIVKEFMQQTIGRIEKYDADHATELLKTGIEFVGQSCKYQATAEHLGIHASTLRYRLQRLVELFALDLEDEETRFALSLAIKLRDIYGR